MPNKAMERKVQLPMAHIRADMTPSTFDKAKRTIECTWTTGKKGLRYTWDGSYYEELSLDPANVRMGRLESGKTPFVDCHQVYLGNRSVIGLVLSAKLEQGRGTAVIQLCDPDTLKDPNAQDTIRKIEQGILQNISVGYNVYTYERQPAVEGEDVPTYLAVDWEPTEISSVPVGFDEGATVRGKDAAGVPCTFVNKATQERENKEESNMGLRVDTPAAPTVDVDQVKKEAAEQARAAEKARNATIRKEASSVGLTEEFIKRMIEGDKSVDQAREAIVAELAARSEATAVRSATSATVQVTRDEGETRRQGITQALMVRMALQGVAITDMSREFAGMSLLRMAEECLGASARGLDPSKLAIRALTSSDFPLLLGNVAEKVLLAAYATLGKTFEPFVIPGELSDYKPAYRYQVGDAPALLLKKEGAEYTYGSFGEKRESIVLADYGRKLRFSRQMLINDDLGAFQRIIQNFGASASRLESKMVYTDTLVANAALADGVTLFHANHKNAAGAVAIDEAGLTAAEKLIMEQQTLDKADYLNLVGKYLVCGTAKRIQALKMLTAVTPKASGDVNPFQNAYSLIVDPRVPGNNWFLICSPSSIPTIEIARLRGENGPVVDSMDDFDADGLEIKCRHTVAVKALEYRGMVFASGA